MQNLYRILDVNTNRAVEGLRVLEEYARFHLEDRDLSSSLRTLRHEIRHKMSPYNLLYRNSQGDLGLRVSASNTLDHKSNLKEVIRANASRAQESLRVLEEYLKILMDHKTSKTMESLRFQVYDLEKKLFEPFCLKGLYALTGPGTEEEILEQAALFVRHKVPILQYRDKVHNLETKERIAHRIRSMTQATPTKFILNDHLDLAIRVGADGIHVGQGDLPVAEVKRLAPHLLVGVSTHNMDQFLAALKDQPDYIALGPIYETKSKANPEACEGLSFITKARHLTPIPLVAIGGLKEDNLDPLLSLGVDAFAMIAAIATEDDLLRHLKKIGDSHVHNSNRCR